MDIRNWPMNKIMQLPDCCFGRRWPIVFTGWNTVALYALYISEIGLPDKCILWELWLSALGTEPGWVLEDMSLTLSLGDKLPATLLEFRALENMFPEADEIEDTERLLRPNFHLTNLRKPYHSQGRRVVLKATSTRMIGTVWSVGLVFSSIPTEVPDWLCSGRV